MSGTILNDGTTVMGDVSPEEREAALEAEIEAKKVALQKEQDEQKAADEKAAKEQAEKEAADKAAADLEAEKVAEANAAAEAEKAEAAKNDDDGVQNALPDEKTEGDAVKAEPGKKKGGK